MLSHLRPAIVLLALFTLLTGVIYPLVVTGVAQLFFPQQANGSLIVMNGQVRGSELIGQAFTSPGYFWGRPSATGPFPYNAAASSGSNLGPTNPALVEQVQARIQTLQAAGGARQVPVDLVTTSGSGLDPQISPAAAEYQVERVAQARNLTASQVRQLVMQHTQGKFLGVIGEARVNVLPLNIALDALTPQP